MSILLLSVLGFAPCACRGQQVDNSTVKSLDLHRFMGTWYEIARFDHRFERGLTHAKAHYALKADGTVAVTNSGLKKGKVKVSAGRAKLTETAGLLRVSFFGPFYADYRVLVLSDDYSCALIGSGSSEYLWILSRTPTLPEEMRRWILIAASDRGYDTGRLIWVEQLPDAEPEK